MARRLKLQDEDHVLEIETADGSDTIRMKIVRATILNQTRIEQKEIELRNKVIANEITTPEYYIQVLELVTENWEEVKGQLENLTLDQLAQISEMISDIRTIKVRTKEEKKTID